MARSAECGLSCVSACASSHQVHAAGVAPPPPSQQQRVRPPAPPSSSMDSLPGDGESSGSSDSDDSLLGIAEKQALGGWEQVSGGGLPA